MKPRPQYRFQQRIFSLEIVPSQRTFFRDIPLAISLVYTVADSQPTGRQFNRMPMKAMQKGAHENEKRKRHSVGKAIQGRGNGHPSPPCLPSGDPQPHTPPLYKVACAQDIGETVTSEGRERRCSMRRATRKTNYDFDTNSRTQFVSRGTVRFQCASSSP